MIQLLSTLSEYFLAINFISHLIIFFGGLYIALHSRVIPLWLITCLWYIGLSSLLISITIVFEYTFGNSFIFSYTNFGIVGETLLNLTICTTIILLFSKTVLIDYKNKSKRITSPSEIKL